MELIIEIGVAKGVWCIFLQPGEGAAPGVARGKACLLGSGGCQPNIGEEDKKEDSYYG